jgi:DNA-binding HxlR family transcriptional regulator
VRRFEDMRVRTAIPRQVLSDRLDALVAAEVLRREPYREPGARTRYEYRLTDKGLDAYPVLVALMAWGDRYLADEVGPAAEFVHRGCDEPVHLEMRCAADHLVEPRDVGGRPGPGAVPLVSPAR